MLLRIIIADDEPLAREKLRLMLDSEPDVQVVAECSDGAQTLQALNTHKPDLLLLDIRMPEFGGFELLEQLPDSAMPMVIFTTAFDQHAVQAFEAQALDYLLKPFDHERLRQALNRARDEMLTKKELEATQRVFDFISKSATQHPSANRRLIVKAGGRIVFLSVDEIDWVEAAANYVRIYAGKQAYILRRGIGEIAERLDPLQFVRIHRSAIVNVQKIKELQPVNSGEYILVLRDGKELPCSRGYRSGLQGLIENTL